MPSIALVLQLTAPPLQHQTQVLGQVCQPSHKTEEHNAESSFQRWHAEATPAKRKHGQALQQRYSKQI